MKRYHVVLLALVFLTFGLILYLHSGRPRSAGSFATTNSPLGVQGQNPSELIMAHPKEQQLHSQSTGATGSSTSEEYLRYIQNIRADPAYDWKQPIVFYGKVVDESNEPVPQANVDYTWSCLSPTGTATQHGTSDETGLFTIHEIGKGISITVSKDGFYTPRNEKLRSYEYANPGDGLFTPDPDNPVLFHLRKKGKAEPLIVCGKKIAISIGSRVSFDPRNCLLNPSGTPVQFELLTNAGGGPMEWEMRLTVSTGGIQLATNEFSFLAPEDNYLPSVELTLDSPRPESWRDNGYAGGVVFVRMGANFGKIEVRMIPGSSYFRLLSYFNPSNSRNLEFDPSNAFQVNQ
jgi:hypothetical protein